MAERFMQKGTTKFHFVPAIVGVTGIPTVAEVTAGEYIGADLADVSGFNFENDPIETPDMDATFTSTIPGEDKADTSTLTFYERKGLANNPAKAAMPKGTTGFIVIFPFGYAGAAPAADDEIDVWPVNVASVSRAYNAGNEASKYMITYTIVEEPILDVEVA
jgi:hypothetical protein